MDGVGIQRQRIGEIKNKHLAITDKYVVPKEPLWIQFKLVETKMSPFKKFN